MKDLTDLLIRASESGCTWLVESLLQSGRVDPTADDSYALRWAAENGHLEVARVIEEYINNELDKPIN